MTSFGQKIFFAVAAACFAGQAAAIAYQPIEFKHFSITPVQKNLIESSGPVAESVLASDGSLWMLTDASLWRWYPITGVVQKINAGIELNLKGNFRAMGTLGDGVYIAVDGHVWRFSSGSGDVDQFQGSWKSDCKNVRFWGDRDFFGVSNECGAWSIDRYGKILRSFAKIPEGKSSSSAAAYVPDCKCLWLADGRGVRRITLEKDRLKIDDLYEAKSSFLGVAAVDEHVIGWTSYAVIVFDAKSGKRIQVVPTSGSRRIIAAAFSPQVHTILFHDGTLETMAPASKKAWTSRVSAPDGANLELDPGAAFLVVRSKDTLPAVLDLEPLKLTSPEP